MQQNTSVFAPIITFGPQKFETIFYEQKNKKFPTLVKHKKKKFLSNQKINIQEDFEQADNQKSFKFKQSDNCLKVSISNVKKIIPFSSLNLENFSDSNKLKENLKRRTSKITFPRVFQNKFLLENSKQKRTISLGASTTKHIQMGQTLNKAKYKNVSINAQRAPFKFNLSQSKQINQCFSKQLTTENILKKKLSGATNNPRQSFNLNERIKRMKSLYG